MTSILLALYLAAVPTVAITGKVLAPDGGAPLSGSVTCRLTTAASALDGVTMQAVAGEVTATLGVGGTISMALVPNDAMTPTGTRYTCTYQATMPNGRRVQWARQWQVASSPATQDVGSVPVPLYPLGACMPSATPTFSLASGQALVTDYLAIYANTPDSIIYYTSDGSTPTTSSTIYTGPIPLSQWPGDYKTIKAMAVPLYGWSPSAVASVALVIPWTTPLTSNGALLAEDAGTVAHVYWNGSALVDTKGNAWTQNGTVPQVAANASPFVPGKAGAGPFSIANNYQGPTTLGEFSGAQDFSVTVVVVPTSVANAQTIISKTRPATTAGWWMEVAAGTGVIYCRAYDGAGRTAATPTGLVLGAINVVTCGRSGGNLYARLNSGASASIAIGTIVATPSDPIRIGLRTAANQPADGVRVYEVIASTTPYSDALHATRFAAVWGQSALTVTRALDTQTYVANGSTWTAPAGALATASSGASIWKASTNSVLNSGTHPKTAEATASIGTGSYVAWHAGTGTMTLAAGTATVTGLTCTAVSPGTLCPFTVTVAGTMAITTSAGTVTQAQIEAGSYATPYITTAGASATRNATVATYTTTAGIGNKGCVAATASPGGGRAWNSATVELLAQGTAGAANYWDLSIISGAAVFSYRDGSNTIETCTGGSGLTAGAHRIHACLNNSVISMWVDGATYACTTSGSAGLRTAEPSTVYLGQDSGGAYLNGNLSLASICKGASSPGDCN